MPDYSKCSGRDCSKRSDCLRYTSKPDLLYQAWFEPEKKEDCEYFMDNRPK